MAQDTTMNFQFTQLGVDLATKALAGTTKITFTKAVASSENHFSDTEATALALTTLGEVQQTIEIKTVMAVTDNKAQVKVPVVIDRGAITTDYSLLSIGLYAKDDDGTEVLYAVNGLQDAVEMRANAFNSTYSIDLYVAVGTSDNVTLTVDAAGMLPRTEFTAVMAEYMKIADMPKDLAYTDKANTFTEQQTLAGGAVDSAGNAIATTKNVSDGDVETLTSAKAYVDTKVSGKADDSKVVHTADMRKPASDVAGIEEVNAKQDKLTITPADDSKVAHLSGANNFDTVPTVNNNPLAITSDVTTAISTATANAVGIDPNTSQITNTTVKANAGQILIGGQPAISLVESADDATALTDSSNDAVLHFTVEGD